MAMLNVEFGGLQELARAVENYRDNINTLYGGHDRYILAPERVLRNIVVAMYSRYIDLWPVSGACCGHRSLLMYSMLEFAMLMGRYCRRERQLTQHCPVDPSDPRLTVESLIQDPEENERSAKMDLVFHGAMQLLGDPDRVLYAEPVSMAQHYDLMVAGSRHIGYLPDRPSRKTAEGVAALYNKERGELLNKIDGYLQNRKMECGIVVPTCLRTPVLILDPPECMRRYHKPELQGAFPTEFPIEGFGPVQPRNDLRRSIIPPNFRELPERVAAAMTTLIREDIQAADAADAEYHAPLRGLPPLLSSSKVTSSTSPRRSRRPSEGAESTDTESARYMDDLNMEETRCLAVRDTLHCSGHSCMRCPAALRDRNPPAGEVRVDAVDRAPTRRSVSMADVSIAEQTSRHLVTPFIQPLMSLLAEPAPSPLAGVANLSGRQLDANRQSRRDLVRRAPSPAEPEHSKKARTPSTEEDEGIEEMVRHSLQQRQRRACSRSRGRRRHGRKGRSQSRPRSQAPVAEPAAAQKHSYIPAGHENTRREELRQEAKAALQKEAKLEKERARREAERAASLEEKLREDVFNHQKDYVDRAYRRLKQDMKLPAVDARVRCLWIFGGNASIHATYVLAIFDWASKYFKLGGEYPVPKLPGWLTTFISTTSMPRFPDGLPKLPSKRTAMNFPNKAIRSPGTWQWMADLLQYWSDVSNTKTLGGLFRTASPLVEKLMEIVNPHFPAVKERVTWDSVAFGTFHWLEARSEFTDAEKADYERQLKRKGSLNELEIATQRLWQDWIQADQINQKRREARQKASRELPPERRAAQLEREKQAKITGLPASTQTEDRYPGWVPQVRKKPGADTPMPYKSPGDLKRGMTTEERDAALGAELGADDLIDPLASPVPRRSSPGPQTPPQFMDADIDIPSVALPPASPVTHAENQLLGTEPDSPMIVSSSSTSAVSTPTFSRAPGSNTSSTRGTPISEVSPLVLVTPPPGLGRGVCRYAHAQGLPQQTAFADAMRRNRVQEDPEEPIPKETDPDWM